MQLAKAVTTEMSEALLKPFPIAARWTCQQ